MVQNFIWFGVLVVVIYAYEMEAKDLRAKLQKFSRARGKGGKFVRK
jgi:hypothetical protein